MLTKKKYTMKKLSNVLQPLALTATTVVTSFSLLQSSPAQAANLITNGGFETGNFTGWTNDGSQSVGITSPALSNNGTNVAYFGKVGSLGFISQTVATTAGQNYQLSYQLYSDGQTPNEFQVQVDNNTLFDQINIAGQPFTTYNFNFVGTGSDTIKFGGRNDPTWLQLDNVAVNAIAATSVPEPFTVVGTLIGATAAIRMRKKLKAIGS